MRRPWTEAELELLGQIPDAEIVQRTGHSPKSVQSKRQELGFWVRPRVKPWTPAEEELLGQKPDTVVAKLLQRDRSDVRLRRVALYIKPAVERVAHRDWTPEQDKLLGTASEAEIGRRLGRSHASVQMRRLGLGLPSHRQKREQSRHCG